MRPTHHRRILAATIILFTSCLVQGKHDTVTVTNTAATTQTITQQPLTTNASNTPTLQPVPTQTPSRPVPAPASASPVSGSQGEVLLTIALQQAALVNFASAIGGNAPQGIITIQTGDVSAVPPATGNPGSLPKPTATAGLGSSVTGSQTAVVQGALQTAVDPAQGGFPGGNPPNTTVDLPVTFVFLLLYIGGAITHISIYRANAKRGHKFLLSDLMFDFCMVRSVTCIFRIIWVFIQPRGVVLAAQVFFNGGASVIFAVNIFLVQRIIRSMHPKIGWSRSFSIITRVMAISVPFIIILQILSIIFVFLSVGDEIRVNAFESVIKFGVSYLLILVTFPFWAIFLACSIPGPKPEKFGVGSLRVKTSLVMVSAVLLTTGAVIRTYSFFNPQPMDTNDVLYGKPIFYTTQFMMEILVVAAYALFRFDLLFHIPNGSSGPGDYSASSEENEKGQIFTREYIEDRIAFSGVPHQILSASYSKSTVKASADQPIYAVFFPQTSDAAGPQEEEEEQQEQQEVELPPRPPRRVSRRETIMEFAQRRPASMAARLSIDGFNRGRTPGASAFEPWSPQYEFTRPRKPPPRPA